MSDRRTERLSEYLDGDLDARTHAELESHLAGCAACRETLDELKAVVAHARTVEPLDPVANLWPAIAARIERPEGWLARLRRWRDIRHAWSLPQAALAALAIALISGGTVWLLLPHGSVTPAARSPMASGSPGDRVGGALTKNAETTTVERSGAASPTGPSASLAGYDLVRYDAAIDELERALRENRAQLDTSTVRIIEQNLDIVDRAIREARRALVTDPANPYLNGHLAEQLERKVRMLQQATAVAAYRQG